MSWYDSYQDVRHHYEDYDPCEHGQDSRCPACRVQMLEQQAAQDTEEIALLQWLLADVMAGKADALQDARAYLQARGIEVPGSAS